MKEKDIILFVDGNVTLEVPITPEKDTVWLTQDQMSQLFDTARSSIAYHIGNIFKEGELNKDTSVELFDRSEKQAYRPPLYYNLDVIISVGYRVKSKRGVAFRKWANKVLKDYILKGYAVNHNRISQLGEVIKIMKQRKYRGNLPNIRRVRSLSYTGGKSCESALFSDEESLIFGWK